MYVLLERVIMFGHSTPASPLHKCRRSDWAGLNWAGIWAGMSGRRHMSLPSSSWAGISLSLALSRPPLFSSFHDLLCRYILYNT